MLHRYLRWFVVVMTALVVLVISPYVSWPFKLVGFFLVVFNVYALLGSDGS